MYLGKLINPTVIGLYQNDGSDGMYLYPRVVTLWVYIHYMIFARAEQKRKSLHGIDWRNADLTLTWGAVNQGAGDQFQDRVEKTIDDNHGLDKEVAYDAKRVGVGILWASFRGMISLSNVIGEGGDDIVEEFQSLKKSFFGDGKHPEDEHDI